MYYLKVLDFLNKKMTCICKELIDDKLYAIIDDYIDSYTDTRDVLKYSTYFKCVHCRSIFIFRLYTNEDMFSIDVVPMSEGNKKYNCRQLDIALEELTHAIEICGFCKTPKYTFEVHSVDPLFISNYVRKTRNRENQ